VTIKLQNFITDNVANKAVFMADAIPGLSAVKHRPVIARLPPYHCNLNPIELVWSQVKSYFARRNKTVKFRDVFGLVTSAVSHITSQRWQAAIDHVIQEEGRMWELDGLADNVVDRLVINIGDAETSSDEVPLCSDTDSDMEDIHPLPDSD
jgi:hypothetical protein